MLARSMKAPVSSRNGIAVPQSRIEASGDPGHFGQSQPPQTA